MKSVRVYDHAGAVLCELLNVDTGSLHPSGALVVSMNDRELPGRLRYMLFAAGTWGSVEEWNASDPADQHGPGHCSACCGYPNDRYGEHDHAECVAALAEHVDHPDPWEQLAEPEPEPEPEPAPALPDPEPHWSVAPLPAIPGESLGIMRDPLMMNDALRLRYAMTVPCQCDPLRCPVTEPAPTPTGLVTVRCDQLAEHPGDHTMPEPYSAGRWPWGPHNHHPKCPRFPGNYNAGEGQPPAAGLTPATGRELVRRSGGSVELAAAGALRVLGFTGAATALAGALAAPETAVQTIDDPTGWFYDRGMTELCAEPYSGPMPPAGWSVGRGRCTSTEPTGHDPDGDGGPLLCERPAGHDGTHSVYRAEYGQIEWLTR